MEINIHENRPNLPPANLEAEIERLNEELLIERDRSLRALADFKNYKRRIETDGNRIAEKGKREIILFLLNIIDDLEKALQSAKDPANALVKGIQIIHKKLLVMLEKNGVLPFDSVGMPFNHNLHEAVMMVNQEGIEPGTVVDELRRGYLWNNELLRAAQVRNAG